MGAGPRKDPGSVAGPGLQACAARESRTIWGGNTGLLEASLQLSPRVLQSTTSFPLLCSPRSSCSSQGWASTEGPGVGRDCRCRPQREQSDRPLQPYVPQNQVLGRHPSALADFQFVLAGGACSDLDPHQRPGYRQLQEGGQGPAGRMGSWARALPSTASPR